MLITLRWCSSGSPWTMPWARTRQSPAAPQKACCPRAGSKQAVEDTQRAVQSFPLPTLELVDGTKVHLSLPYLDQRPREYIRTGLRGFPKRKTTVQLWFPALKWKYPSVSTPPQTESHEEKWLARGTAPQPLQLCPLAPFLEPKVPNTPRHSADTSRQPSVAAAQAQRSPAQEPTSAPLSGHLSVLPPPHQPVGLSHTPSVPTITLKGLVGRDRGECLCKENMHKLTEIV